MAWCARVGVCSVLSVALLASGFWPGRARAASYEDPPSELATVLARKGRAAEKSGDLAQAYVYYSQASALQPKNKGYRTRAAALQARGAKEIQSAASAPASALPGADQVRDPEVRHAYLPADLMFDSRTAREISKERQLKSPPKLNAAAGQFNIDITDTPRGLFEKVCVRYNLQVVFDSDYPQGGQPIRFHVEGVDYRAAFDALQIVTGSFVVPIGTRALMVARDTIQKRNDLEQYIVLTLGVPQVITAQELTEIVQVVRQVTGVEKIGWDTNTDQIVVRDRVSRAALAQALLDQLFGYHPQVMIDVELLQVSDSDIVNYGFSVTNTIPLIWLSSLQHSVPSIPQGITNLLTFGGGKTLVGIVAAQVQAMFNQGISSSRSLYSARLRAGSGATGSIHVGSKYPIITGGFVNGSTGSNGGLNPSFVAPPAITFENLGLEMKLLPRVHGADDVSIAIEATYEALTGESASGIPIIQNTKVTTEVRVRDNEWSIIGGLIGDSNSRTTSGTWGLASIPFLGQVFKKTSIDKSSSSFLIGVRPHIVSIGPDEKVTDRLRAGTDARPFTPL